jgi:Flp pilus assembly protein TadD
MSGHEQVMRAALLFQQHRYADAERTLRDHLRNEPQDALAMRLLGESLLAQDRTAEARATAQGALGLAPMDAAAFGLLARVELMDDAADQALTHAREACRLEPGDADHWGTLAFVELRLKQHNEALGSADRGLAVDPENLRCLNMRTEALARLGRKEEADATIHRSLGLDPENPYTHSNTGWAVLRRGEHQRALEHFREALRRDPTNAHAKSGMVEALKARYWIYRIFLRYQFWVSNLKGNAQWMLILGLYFGNRLLRALADSVPALAPFIWPLLIAYLLFALSTWVMTPLSNLLLRLNRFGRYALDRAETITSTFTGIALGLAAIGGTAFLLWRAPWGVALGLYGLAMMIPLATMLGARRKGRKILVGMAVVLAVIGALGVALTLRTGDALNTGMSAFLLGAFAYQWLANIVAIRN